MFPQFIRTTDDIVPHYSLEQMDPWIADDHKLTLEQKRMHQYAYNQGKLAEARFLAKMVVDAFDWYRDHGDKLSPDERKRFEWGLLQASAGLKELAECL